MTELSKVSGIDWILFLALLPILAAGLVTMSSFTGQSVYFDRQLIWIGLSLVIFFSLSFVDFRFLRRTEVVVSLYLLTLIMLVGLSVFGHITNGAQSWFNFGAFSIQPSDPAKLVLVILLAKYFSRRHVEIRHVRHILVSGIYAFIFFFLILIEPDFGSSIIIFLIWLGMVLLSGISKKHFFIVFGIGAVAFAGLWFYALKPYQKARIVDFIHPLTNIAGSGYNAYQSTIAFGSGGLLGKGLGFGTQSRLNFLPEHQTDFIFAAFAEEWGFVGVVTLLILFVVVIWRIILNAMHGVSNFEILFGAGLAIYFMAHIIINFGMNMGILPVTGLVAPFMSYGGSHLLTEFAGLGILMGMRRYRRTAHKDVMQNEFLGI